MNLRELVGIEDEPYFKFNREERHLAAILFYLLNSSDNAERVLRSVDPTWKINPEEFGIYFEYSYPRDLWHRLKVKSESNKCKRDAIIAMLGTVGFDTTKLTSLIREKEFNAFFIGPRGSSHFIQSPANWSLTQLVKSLPLQGDENDLLTACKVKWAFRVKPDLVIHADRGRALCIELKLESGEGSYPSSGIEKKLLKGKKLFAEKQTQRALQ